MSLKDDLRSAATECRAESESSANGSLFAVNVPLRIDTQRGMMWGVTLTINCSSVDDFLDQLEPWHEAGLTDARKSDPQQKAKRRL